MIDKIAICIPTYKRLNLLKKLVYSINKLKLPDNFKGKVIVIVVDNDIKKSAESILKVDCQFEIYYFCEPAKGLSNVRNKLILESLYKKCNYIAFIDDDEEVVSSNWLLDFFECINRYNADIVAGPVITRYSNVQENWSIDSGVYNRKRYSTGTKILLAGAGNLFLRTDILSLLKYPYFDESFNRTGGEDTDFFYKIKKINGNVVWCDEAMVSEELTVERTTFIYLLKRSFSGGMIYSRCNIKYSDLRLYTRIKYLADSILKIILYSLLIILKPYKIPVFVLKITSQIGKLVGLFNFNFNFNRY